MASDETEVTLDHQLMADAAPNELRKQHMPAVNFEMTVAATLAVLWDVATDVSVDVTSKVVKAETKLCDMVAQTSSLITAECGIQAESCMGVWTSSACHPCSHSARSLQLLMELESLWVSSPNVCWKLTVCWH